jgi:hypothetical protein
MSAGPDDARRAAALRANLLRRKSQQRGRSAEQAAPGDSAIRSAEGPQAADPAAPAADGPARKQPGDA